MYRIFVIDRSPEGIFLDPADLSIGVSAEE